MGCCACVQSKKVAPASPPPPKEEEEYGENTSKDHAPIDGPGLNQRPPRSTPPVDRTPRRNSNRASPRTAPPPADPSPALENSGTRRDRRWEDDVMPGQVPGSVPPSSWALQSSAVAVPQPPISDSSSSGEYEMPEEQSQAATAGDEPAVDAALFPRGAHPGVKVQSRFDNDDDDDAEGSDASTSSDDGSDGNGDDDSSQGKARAAAVLKNIRRKNGVKAPKKTAGSRNRKISLKQFDSDEYEPPQEEVVEQRAQGPARSARLIL